MPRASHCAQLQAYVGGSLICRLCYKGESTFSRSYFLNISLWFYAISVKNIYILFQSVGNHRVCCDSVLVLLTTSQVRIKIYFQNNDSYFNSLRPWRYTLIYQESCTQKLLLLSETSYVAWYHVSSSSVYELASSRCDVYWWLVLDGSDSSLLIEQCSCLTLHPSETCFTLFSR